MWFLKHKILEKQEGLEEDITDDFLTKPFTEKEFGLITKHIPDNKNHQDLLIPSYLKLPNEYIALLKYSKSGIIVNGEREFGFFDITTIREFYINYGFIIYAPNLLPIAFNGGGTFYVYHFTKKTNTPPIYAVHSSNIGNNDSTCFLGNTLEEVLSKTKNIDDEIDEKRPKIELNEAQKNEIELSNTKAELNIKLKSINDKKNNGEIDLKTYLKSKKEIQQKLNSL